MAVRIVGVDPGIVHTGVVELLFDTDNKEILIDSAVGLGSDLPNVRGFIERKGEPLEATYIEGYRTRSNFNTDTEMKAAVRELSRGLSKAKVIDNMGVKKIVRRPLMELLGVWKFSTVTHHQDLRSAARIALFGMLKEEHLNELLADVVRDHLNKEAWHVTVR